MNTGWQFFFTMICVARAFTRQQYLMFKSPRNIFMRYECYIAMHQRYSFHFYRKEDRHVPLWVNDLRATYPWSLAY